MPQYKYLIVGGGMTADAAVQGIRQVDHDGSIGLIGSESHRPYDRPPLSKGLWKGKSLGPSGERPPPREATLHLGRAGCELSMPHNNRVTDDRGTVYGYEKLLLATGGAPRRLAGLDSFGPIYFRTLDDYSLLRLLAGSSSDSRSLAAGSSARKSPRPWP